jgi:parallel beta-helix repeat protein
VGTVAALMILVGDPARAQATTRYVATTGTDIGGCTDPNDPCRTVQYAVDAASDEDLIKVATGTYTGVQGRPAPPEYLNPPASGIITQAVFISKTVTIRGGYATPGFADPPDPETNPTKLDAQGQGRVLLIGGDPSAGSGQAISPTIEGLCITGGDASELGGAYWEDAGGGVYVISATATISNNQVFSNTADYGGGLWQYKSDATLSANTVVSNTASAAGFNCGGGLGLYSSPYATLSGNTISGNTAYGDGGGLCLYYSGDATLSGNTISGNTAHGDGGGLYLYYSYDATLSDNTISSNSAHSGGGLRLYLSPYATLSGNTISGNYGGSGSGGGLCLDSSPYATLSGNTIRGNTAGERGGGVYGGGTFVGNTISDNSAGHGGGLWLGWSDATLSGNTITGNDARNGSGGGLFLDHSDATVSGNTISDNDARNGSGGGLFLGESDATLSANTVSGNSADYGGGGLFLYYSAATLVNDIIADNQANRTGSGLHFEVSSARLLHTTIARNGGGDGSGVYVAEDSYGNPSTVAMTNTILVSHTVGITVEAGCTATLESTLWNGNTSDWGGPGTINRSHDYTGNPAFVDPDAGDYHIGAGSSALDQGVDAGVLRDIDNEPRFDVPDLGADEYWAPGALRRIYLPLILRNGP